MHHWEAQFIASSKYANYSLKTTIDLDVFKIESVKLERVSEDVFYKYEEGVLPLFLSTSMGLHPNDYKRFEAGTFVAVLGKSMLSGWIAGLTVYRINEDENTIGDKIDFFSNVNNV